MVCPSVCTPEFLAHSAKAVVRTEMPLAKDTRVAPTITLQCIRQPLRYLRGKKRLADNMYGSSQVGTRWRRIFYAELEASQ